MIFQLNPISNTFNRSNLLDNYDIRKGESYFNIPNKKIVLKTPVANDNFIVEGIFYLTTGEPLLIVHITDKTSVARKEEPSKFFLDIEISFEDVIVIGSDEFYIHPDDHLAVVIFNDDTIINKVNAVEETQIARNFGSSLINNSPNSLIIKEVKTFVNIGAFGEGGYFEPKESGGGVIITGP